MGLGVLEVRSGEHVPGTVAVLEQSSRPRNQYSQLKHDGDIILVPQPSNDPNDPLNWPLWKRDLALAILSLTSVFAVSLGPILAANTLTISLNFRRDFTAIALLTGYYLAGLGLAGALLVPTARVFGKRHLYLLGTALLVFSSVWGGRSRSYKSLLWARVFQGVATAPFEALVNASVGDLYFVHQRGIRMAITTLSLFGSSFFTPIVVGRITHSQTWPWTFYWVAIFSGIMLPLVFFFVPETTYRRHDHLETDIVMSDYSNETVGSGQKSHIATSHDSSTATEDSRTGGTPEDQAVKLGGHEPISQHWSAKKASYASTLLPFNGVKSSENILKLFLRPFPLFFQPAILWACLTQGVLIGWTVFIGVVLAAIFLGPPLFFDEVRTGYMYTSAFIGAMLGFVVSGVFSDWSARIMIRRNKGVYEPEFRVLLALPQLVLGGAGLYGFGITAADVARYGWFWPEFFFALVLMGMVIGAVASALYIVDAHRNISVEAFTCCLMFKNLFSFGLTWSAYGWLVNNGTQKVFLILASVQVGVCLLSVPMYIFGKRNRAFFHRHDILKICGLR